MNTVHEAASILLFYIWQVSYLKDIVRLNGITDSYSLNYYKNLISTNWSDFFLSILKHPTRITFLHNNTCLNGSIILTSHILCTGVIRTCTALTNLTDYGLVILIFPSFPCILEYCCFYNHTSSWTFLISWISYYNFPFLIIILPPFMFPQFLAKAYFG